MKKDISSVKVQRPVLGKLALLRQLRAGGAQLDRGLAAFSERIAGRVLRRDSRAWRRFSLEYLLDEPQEEKMEARRPAVRGPLSLDVLFQIYAGVERAAAPAPDAAERIERLVERRMRLLTRETQRILGDRAGAAAPGQNLRAPGRAAPPLHGAPELALRREASVQARPSFRAQTPAERAGRAELRAEAAALRQARMLRTPQRMDRAAAQAAQPDRPRGEIPLSAALRRERRPENAAPQSGSAIRRAAEGRILRESAVPARRPLRAHGSPAARRTEAPISAQGRAQRELHSRIEELRAFGREQLVLAGRESAADGQRIQEAPPQGGAGLRGLPGLPGAAGRSGARGAAAVEPPRIAQVRQGDVYRQNIYRSELALAQEGAAEGEPSSPPVTPVRTRSTERVERLLSERVLEHWARAASLTGLAGAAGRPGAAGLDGARGLSGAAGAAGLPGVVGAGGSIGLPGAAGAMGLRGLTGLAGAAGAAGRLGARGETGVPGLAGLRGLSGQPGAAGLRGLSGQPGAAGLRGLPGLPGAAGRPGARGAAAVEPPRIAQVRQGDVYRQNIYRAEFALAQEGAAEGEPSAPSATPVRTRSTERVERLLSERVLERWVRAASLTGLAGAAGRIGAAGAAGARGLFGAAGAAGLPGVVGAGGPTGSPGAMGLRGLTGLPGAAGAAGRLGARGETGVPGLAGLRGLSGQPGAAGLRGLPGLPGAAGRPGAAAMEPPRIAKVRQGDVYRQNIYRSELALAQEGAAEGEPSAPSATPVRTRSTERVERLLSERVLERWVRAASLTGLAGAAGRPGAAGAAGARGFSGAAGHPGAAGAAGARGLFGAAGAAGLPGLAGAGGPTGSPGAMGLRGLTGLPGAAGAAGRLGARGETGVPGLAGLRGLPGLPGTVGPPGARGAAAVEPPRIAQVRQGDVYRQSIYRSELALAQEGAVEGELSSPPATPVRTRSTERVERLLSERVLERWARAASPTGLAGARGLPGAAGRTGAAGFAGLPGLMGAAGAAGLPGLVGAGSPSGLPGATGAAGAAGRLGARGETGVPGLAGLRGLSGQPGGAGLRGLPGLPGAAGRSGARGAAAMEPPRIAQVRQGDVYRQNIYRTELALAQEEGGERPERSGSAGQSPAAASASGLRTTLQRALAAVERRERQLLRPTGYAPLRPALREMRSRARPLRTAVEGQAGMTRLVHSRQERAERSTLEWIAMAGEGSLRPSILTSPAEIVMLTPPTHMNAYGAPAPRVGNLSWDEQPGDADRNSGRAAVELLRRAQQKFGAPARYRPPEMVLKEKGEATGRLASQSAGQAPSINQEMRARRRVEEKVQTQELSNAEITRIVDRVYRKLESRIATEYRRRGM